MFYIHVATCSDILTKCYQEHKFNYGQLTQFADFFKDYVWMSCNLNVIYILFFADCALQTIQVEKNKLFI